MKVLILLVACVALAAAELNLTAEQKERAHAVGLACTQQEGVTKEQAQALRQGNFDNVDAKMKCFANCFLDKTGFFVDGEVKPDVVQEKLSSIVDAEKLKAIQAKCDATKGDDKCDTAFKLYQCYYQNHVEL